MAARMRLLHRFDRICTGFQMRIEAQIDVPDAELIREDPEDS